MSIRSLLATLSLLCAVATPVHAMSSKPKVSVRFHVETNAKDGDSFAMPVKLLNQQRETFLSRIPAFSEHQIKTIYPFPAKDGTWGCVFILTDQGRIRLDSLSSESRGAALVVFIGTKTGQHQVVDMIIDRPVSDGIITVPSGITEAEVTVLRQQFPVRGEEKVKKKKELKKKEDPDDWAFERGTGPRINNPDATAPAEPRPRSTNPPPTREQLRGLDLPRLAD